MANHIRVFTAIVFSQLVVFYFGLQMNVSLSELIFTVGVASLLEIIYHVRLVRKIGADISFETFWKNCDQLFRKNAVLFFFLVFYHIIFKGGDFVSFMIWQVFFVVLVTTIILASNDAPESR
ncbi:hypothetical protein [Streptococcus salivarius]|uniref:hypothetical protein n=1 Tax=Streptococcus salivarius TaxID=1304 RepID=UPI0019197DC4|nr:hypothetical protein [Streptococcus salivarius]